MAQRARHSGTSLIEVLIVIAIVSLLAALSVPAMQAAREASRRASCENNLRQYGMAMYGFENKTQRFPSAMTFRITGPLEQSEWAIHDYMSDLIPHLEISNATGYDYTVMFNHPRNHSVIAQSIPIGVCPSTPTRDSDYHSTCVPSAIMPQSVRQNKIVAPLLDYMDKKYSATYRAEFCDYTVIGGAEADLASKYGFTAKQKSTAGIYGMFPYPVENAEEALEIVAPAILGKNTVTARKGLRAGDIGDGLSNTLMMVEIAGWPQHWRHGLRHSADEPLDRPWADARSVQQLSAPPGESALLQTDNLTGPYSFHAAGVTLLFADGHVELASTSTESKQFLHWLTPNDTEPSDK